VKITGGNRKYLLHKLANRGKTAAVRSGGKTAGPEASPCKRRKGGGRKPKYTGGVVIVLRKIWAFFSYQCGKILAPFMREQMGFLEAPFRITQGEKELLLSASPSTVDKILRADRKKLALKGKSGTKSGKLLKKQIPVRTYYADADKKPGFLEVDTVHHCGTSNSGEFCLTLTAHSTRPTNGCGPTFSRPAISPALLSLTAKFFSLPAVVTVTQNKVEKRK
jgi:hypothetical protein